MKQLRLSDLVITNDCEPWLVTFGGKDTPCLIEAGLGLLSLVSSGGLYQYLNGFVIVEIVRIQTLRRISRRTAGTQTVYSRQQWSDVYGLTLILTLRC